MLVREDATRQLKEVCHMLRTSYVVMIMLVASVLFLGCKGEGPTNPGADRAASMTDVTTSHHEYNPEINPDDFVGVIDNPYLAFAPGKTFLYSGETEDGTETGEVFVTFDTKVILGVTTTVVHDRVMLNGSLIEETFDWYAQDKDGNVWYFGEDSKEFKDGVIVSTEGSWEAGKDGALPGIIMLAHPKIGTTYRQEFALDVAEDMAKVLSLKKPVSIPYGDFEDCLQTMEWTPLQPGQREFKYYAPGVGLVLEFAPRGGGTRIELIDITL
jgi:hypothetical protein